MPTNIRIIHAHEFIKATPEGLLNLEESKKMLIEVAAAAVPLKHFDVILDIRRTQSTMSRTDLWYLAAELASIRGGFAGKTAVICAPEWFDLAGFFALCSQNNGFQVCAFTAYEQAIKWLVSDKSTLVRPEEPSGTKRPASTV